MNPLPSKNRRRFWFVRAGLVTAALAAGVLVWMLEPFGPSQSAQITPEKLEYNRDIRPILSENCFACHGPDSASRKAKLRLDVRDEAVKRGAIVPGQPDKSLLVQRIFAKDSKQQMPPAKSHKTLTTAQKEKLKAWIAQGAEYQPHWSYITPKRP